MNILFLNSARDWGGNEKWSLVTATGLAARGHRVFFGCRSSLFEERSGNTPVTFVRFPLANQGDFLSILMISAFIRRHKVDVVIPTRQREYLLGGLAAWPVKRARVVARLGIDRPLRTARSRFAFTRLFDGVIVNAASIVRTLAKTPGFDACFCRVIHNGIGIQEIEPDVRERVRTELGIGNNQFLIGCAGRCTPQKGFDRAIGAFSALAAAAPEARLVIVGDGPQLEDYRKLARSTGVVERVIFTGFRTDLPDLLQALDLFWLTSRSEGMPNVLLEACASGIPAIAFDVAGVPELIENGKDGVIVAQGDLEALADATRLLLRDSDRRKALAIAGREKVGKKFSMDRMVGAVEKYLFEVRMRSSLECQGN
jgi:glycosyltransferase involved in cell wall biosynthesis